MGHHIHIRFVHGPGSRSRHRRPVRFLHQICSTGHTSLPTQHGTARHYTVLYLYLYCSNRTGSSPSPFSNQAQPAQGKELLSKSKGNNIPTNEAQPSLLFPLPFRSFLTPTTRQFQPPKPTHNKTHADQDPRTMARDNITLTVTPHRQTKTKTKTGQDETSPT